MIIESIELKNGTAIGLDFEMQMASLLVIKAPKGFVMCGYLDMTTASKLGDCAVKVTGVSNFEEVLAAEIKATTFAAEKLGISKGMEARNALELMF